MLLTDARVVVGNRVLTPGWLRTVGEAIAEVGEGAGPDGADEEPLSLAGRTVVPGFVDLHVHGGGGRSMESADPDDIVAAVEAHRAHGTTSTLVSIMTSPPEVAVRILGAVAELTRRGVVLGAHLEGPFLNPVRAGAHDAAWLLAPDPALLDRLLEAGEGSVRVVTLAPELPGALDLVTRLTSAGVVAAAGHSDVDHEGAVAAFDRGVSLVTHLFNAMRPWHQREPGLAGATLTSPGVTAELIADGVHLHDATARVAVAAAPERLALVTDATPAAAGTRETLRIGGAEAEVRGGVSRRADGTIAGSLLTMDGAFRNVVTRIGMSVEAASRAASAIPARVLGLDDRIGSLAVGRRADLVVLDVDLQVEAVMVAGVWKTSGTLFHI